MTKPGIDIEKIAEEIANHFGDPQNCRFVIAELLRVEQAAAKAERERCVELCRRKYLCGDPAHDDRWCARCSAIQDGADMIEDEILAPNGETK